MSIRRLEAALDRSNELSIEYAREQDRALKAFRSADGKSEYAKSQGNVVKTKEHTVNKFKALYEYGQFSVLLHNLDSVISKVEAAVKLQISTVGLKPGVERILGEVAELFDDAPGKRRYIDSHWRENELRRVEYELSRDPLAPPPPPTVFLTFASTEELYSHLRKELGLHEDPTFFKSAENMFHHLELLRLDNLESTAQEISAESPLRKPDEKEARNGVDGVFDGVETMPGELDDVGADDEAVLGRARAMHR